MHLRDHEMVILSDDEVLFTATADSVKTISHRHFYPVQHTALTSKSNAISTRKGQQRCKIKQVKVFCLSGIDIICSDNVSVGR